MTILIWLQARNADGEVKCPYLPLLSAVNLYCVQCLEVPNYHRANMAHIPVMVTKLVYLWVLEHMPK